MLVLIVLGIIIAVVLFSVFSTTAETVSPEGDVFHVHGCKMNNALASYGFLRDFGVHFPKVLCKPPEKVIDANDCDCEDFDAYIDAENPIEYLYDGNTGTYAEVLAKEGLSEIEFKIIPQVFDYNLTDFQIYVDSSADYAAEKIDIYAKGKNFWDSWEECGKDSIEYSGPAWYSIDTDDCPIPKEGIIKLSFNSLSRRSTVLRLTEVSMTFEDASGVTKDLVDFLETPPYKHEESKDRYSYICKSEKVDNECSEEWKKEWVELELGKLAASCWSMGLEGERQPGVFSCYGGTIENIQGSLASDTDSLLENISAAMGKATVAENLTYRQYLGKSSLAGGSNIDTSSIISFLMDGTTTTLSYIIPSLKTKASANGYPSGSTFAIIYIDVHLLNVLLNALQFSDKVFFF